MDGRNLFTNKLTKRNKTQNDMLRTDSSNTTDLLVPKMLYLYTCNLYNDVYCLGSLADIILYLYIIRRPLRIGVLEYPSVCSDEHMAICHMPIWSGSYDYVPI